VSDDRTWLVSASLDQTVAAWSLKDQWRSNTVTGARFEVKGDRLVAAKVDPGGPAWEAGLVEGDKMKLLAIGRNLVQGGPEAWKKALEEPTVGLTYTFYVDRTAGDKTEEKQLLSTWRQRALWRFFPTRHDAPQPDEWVLWMWRTPFYDTSTSGDSFLAWHVNGPKLTETPRLFKAEQLRDPFQSRDAIDKLIETRDPAEALKTAMGDDNLQPLSFDKIEPPPLQLEVTPEGAA